VPVGASGFAKSAEIELLARDQKLYSITYQRMVPHEQIYIATPE
jgi:hypothetical protein